MVLWNLGRCTIHRKRCGSSFRLKGQFHRLSGSGVQAPCNWYLFLCLCVFFFQKSDLPFISFFVPLHSLCILKRHQISSIVLLIVSSGKSVSVKEQQQFSSVFLRNGVPFCTVFQITVYIFAVNAHHPRRILRTFHTPFNLQRADSGPGDLWQQINGTHIFGTQKCSLFFPGHPIFTCKHFVCKAAGLGAATPVPASAPKDTAEQTLPGVTIAERTVDKTLYLQIRIPVDMHNLPERQFSGQNDAFHPFSFQKCHAFGTAKCHLRTGMDWQIRKPLPDAKQCAQILHNDGVQPPFIAGQQKIV